MLFTFLVGLTALLVAGTGAYFSVLGIATLFVGSYYEVIVMASALELGKIVTTSYLHRHWGHTNWLLKSYLMLAVVILMAITSMGVFGYLSAAYQVNSSNFSHIDAQVAIIDKQKESIDREIEQNNSRITTLNESRASQEKRLPSLSKLAAAPIYKDIEKSGEEIQNLTKRTSELQELKLEKDKQIIELKQETAKAKDIGTFKFVAQSVKMNVDTVVTLFICVIICVFDPLAVALILAFNALIAPKKEDEFSLEEEKEKLAKEYSQTAEPIHTEPVIEEASVVQQPKTNSSVSVAAKVRNRPSRMTGGYWHKPE